MKSIRLTAVKTLEIHDIAEPVPAPNEALVAIKAVGVCGSDVHYYSQGRIGSDRARFPQTLGHEPAGVVLSAPAGCGLKTGDRVAIEPGHPCYVCEHCISGRHNICPNVKFLGSPGMQGAFQELITVDPRQLAKIPDSMSFDEAVLLEPLGVAYHTRFLSKTAPTDSIAIFGAGPVGLLTLAMFRAGCCGTTFIADRIPQRLEAARDLFGADHVVDTNKHDPIEYIRTATRHRGVDIAVEAAGEQQTFGWTFEAPRIGGTALIVGIPEIDTMSFNPHTARRRELLVQNVRRSNRALEACIELIHGQKLHIAKLATHHFSMENAAAAFELAGAYGDGVIKAIIEI